MFARADMMLMEQPPFIYTVYRVFAKWADDGSLWQALSRVCGISRQQQLDISVLHGDGTNTVAKGDGISYSGYKHQKGEKVIAIIDNHGSVLAPSPWLLS